MTEASVLTAVGPDPQLQTVAAAGRRLAQLAGLRPRFLHVVPFARVPPARSPHSAADEESAEAEAEAGWRGRALLQAAGARSAEMRIALGDAARAILSVAERERPALLVVGSRGRGELGSAVLGSVSRTVVRSAPCPVMIIPPQVEPAFTGRRIVCAVDGRRAEADRVAAVASELAAVIDRQVVLTHVIAGEDAGDVDTGAYEVRLDRELRPALAHVHAALDRVGPDEEPEVQLRRGEPVRELDALARDLDADMLVVGTRGHGPLRSAALDASVASALARSAPCPVVVVPPAAWEGEG